jgi:hypothetical protein
MPLLCGDRASPIVRTLQQCRSQIHDCLGPCPGRPRAFLHHALQVGGPDWIEDNTLPRAHAMAGGQSHAVFDDPNTNRAVTPLDLYDGYHFGASG